MRRFLFNVARKFEKAHHSHAFPSNLAYSSNTSFDQTNISIGRSNFMWVTTINSLVHGETNTELELCEASRMFNSGTKPNEYALANLVRVTTDLGSYSFGQQLHGYILCSGHFSRVYVSASLIRFYVKMHLLAYAHKVFDETPQPNAVSWNTLISGYVQAGQFLRALCLFRCLGRSDVCADAFSFTSALAACGHLSLFILGRSIHSVVVKLGMLDGTVVANCLIDMYGKCGLVEDAVWVFSEIVDKDVISWNSVIAATANNGNIQLAYRFLHLMPNPDTISYNGLINGIAHVGNIEDAVQILLTMPTPNSSSWNSIITGFVNRNRAREALDMFSRMHSRNVQMDEFTFSIILNGLAGIAALTWGMLIHCCAMKCGLDTSVVVGSALIDMYSKCGQVKRAESIFHELPNRNLISWNTMMYGYARNGDSVQVIELFKMLKMEGDIKPDSITFLNLLSACSHNQIPIEVAIHYFESMINDHGITPSVEHCCSMIRLMGQKGELWRAERMIHELGFESQGLVWRALLGACGTQRDIQVAETAGAKVIELERDEDYVYVKLSNMYASLGRWEDVDAIRGLMSKKQVCKEAGSSWIEVESCNT
ncbi:hypothetical protein HN51_068840 [Arachis hypogaea]|uniref:Pentatricopeptide repeat-containing protein n=1 Tax=Arachis hypogaea TaxID=3818 RepID=A0A444Z8S1_ARAHY|nr:putative pentatricopeptide repeat-containing protein At5g47460 [Arachis ipaensis]XP_025653707.1 putative pentatricopeptide repeat-containing protein At5g47460 [Arachis hypogaea]QHO10964.1 Putative pentatricopeptide repeat-containing protein [Arachis hypogaea]RYR10566.1 hypothetical protein Ahy_B05g078994 [Arachis hypogaea]